MSLNLEKIGSQGTGKRPKDFPRLHDDNVTKIIEKFNTLDGTIAGGNGLEEKISKAEQDILDLKAADVTIRSELDNAEVLLATKADQSVVTAINNTLATKADQIEVDSISSQVDSISAQVDSISSQVDSISAQVDSISSQVDSISAQVDLNTLAIYNLSIGGGSITGSSSFLGVVHITNVSNSGNMQKTYLANTNNSVIDSFISDVSNITVELTASSFSEEWLPIVTVNDVDVTGWTEQANGKFKASFPMTLSGTGDIKAEYFNGTSHTIAYSIQTAGPSVLTANLGSFPAIPSGWIASGNQTSLKFNDTVVISGTCNASATYIEVVDDSNGIFYSGSGAVSGGNYSFTAITSSRSGSKSIKLRTRNSLGTYGATFTGTTATLDQTSPSVSSASITYPATQSALKDSETADINVSASDFTEIRYSSPSPYAQLSIPSDTTYSLTKTVTRIAGGYNVSNSNYRVEARKSSNGTSTVVNAIVFIANDSAVISVTTPASRLRSGGNDGTNIENHVIIATSNQRLSSFMMSEQSSYGSFASVWVGASNNTSWTRTLQVSDTHSKGAGTFNSISAVNLAGKVTTTLNSGSSYTLGGFVARTLTLPAFANEVASNVKAVNFAKVTLIWSFKTLPLYSTSTLGDTVTPQANKWTLATLDPATVRILDTSATSSSSQSSSIVLEEVV